MWNWKRWACGAIALLLMGVAGCAQSTPENAATQDTPGGANEEGRVSISEAASGKWSPGLTVEEKETLFGIAEDTLRWCVTDSDDPFPFDAYSVTVRLKEPTATFVTLKAGGRLRGCIGSLAPVAALYRSVHDNAVNAALKDFRFRPVRPGELGDLELHISILSPIVSIASLDEFRIGEHGIIIEKGRHRAVYLPEVAPEQGWTKDETLTSLCQKAGLPDDAWRAGAEFKVFSSVVLSHE